MNITTSVTASEPSAKGTASPSPSSSVIDPESLSTGTGKIQPLKSVNVLEKTDKKEDQKSQPNVIETKKLVEDLNEYMDDLQTNLGFSIREELNHKVVVEIKNRETGELIKQIPNEELLQIQEKMAELSGFIFDQSV
jgi:flagellar protein FlaG